MRRERESVTKMNKRTKIGFSAAAALMLLLIVLPFTGWIVRQQLRFIGGRATPGFQSFDNGRGNVTQHRHAVAQAHPENYQFQLVDALDEGSADKTPTEGKPVQSHIVPRLVELRSRFGDKASLNAHILRYLTTGDLKLSRNEERILFAPVDAKQFGEKALPEKSSTPEVLALALDAATRGEKLDPTNAYFSTMRSFALLAEHRDTESFAALSDAAAKPHWNDYTSEEPVARWALLNASEGNTGAIARTAISASNLFPHFARLRDMARVVVSLAIMREQVGDTEGGFALRQSLARVGATMRSDSPSLIGTLVGAAITPIAYSRPGGAPISATRTNSDAGIASKEAEAAAYLTKIGHPEEAAWYLAERRASDKAKAICSISLGGDNSILTPLIHDAIWWAAGLFTLLSALWMLAFGGLGALLMRTGRVKTAQPLQRGVRVGLLLFLATPFVAGAAAIARSFFETDTSSSDLVLTALIVGFIVIGAVSAYGQRGVDGTTRRRNGNVSQATYAACSVIVLLAGLSCMGIGQQWSSFYELTSVGWTPNSGADPDAVVKTILMFGLSAFVVLTIPILTVITLAIRSRIKRVPVSVGVVRGMRYCALPAAGVLLLVYTGILIGTVNAEQAVDETDRATVTGEGAYYANVLHQEWPKAVDMQLRPADPTVKNVPVPVPSSIR
jgi:hypothetical protein